MLKSPSCLEEHHVLMTGVNCVRNCSRSTLAGSQIQDILRNRINGYPAKIQENTHYAHCYIPANLAAIIEQKPSLVAKGVQSFYYRDPVDLKCCRTMQYFRPGTRVISRVKFTRCLYAQLMQQNFQPDKRSGWVLPSKLNPKYKAHDLGMKLAHGFEILCAKCASNRSFAGNTKQNTFSTSDVRWNRYVTALKEKGYFKGEIEGSVLYQQLLNSAEEFYKSQLHMEENEISQSPGAEILDMLDKVEYDIEERRKNEALLPPPDDDSWLELTPDGLEKILQAKSGPTIDNGQMPSTNGNLSEDRFDLSKVADSMQSFVNKVSGLDGAEFPGEDEDEDDDDIQFDSTGFISSMQKMFEFEDNDDASSSDMSEYDWNDSDDENRPKQLSVRKHVIKPPPRPPPPKVKSKKPTNQQSENSNGSANQPSVKDYMDIMDRELAKTDVGKSFANGGSSNGTADKPKRKPSRNIDDEDDDFVPVNVDLNVVQNMLQSLGAQEGLPGPASNILNSMGIKLPPDADKLADTNGVSESKISPDLGNKSSQDSRRSSQDSRRSSQDSRRGSQDSRRASDAESQGNKNSRSGSLKDKTVSNSPKSGSENGPPRPPPRRPKPVQRQMSKETNV
ncbi:hypothetical protein KUTeg_003181 [Tegillarca granosa]|uniref:Uncharacterized protein n=1 Tax=Tegillarca granosa TaxID=220873 RepID=A0ABQ9FQU7_TEGGR|nr:hypothetical protein KUTeg_003181 [Tegillarca granosa]